MHPSQQADADRRKRSFMLSLDPYNGQHYAMQAGFLPPSEPVVKKEFETAATHWARLSIMGVLPSVVEFSSWYRELRDEISEGDPENALTPQESEVLGQMLVGFTMASIVQLADMGIVQIPGAENVILEPAWVDQDGNIERADDQDLETSIRHLEEVLRNSPDDDEDIR